LTNSELQAKFALIRTVESNEIRHNVYCCLMYSVNDLYVVHPRCVYAIDGGVCPSNTTELSSVLYWICDDMRRHVSAHVSGPKHVVADSIKYTTYFSCVWRSHTSITYSVKLKDNSGPTAELWCCECLIILKITSVNCIQTRSVRWIYRTGLC
jgi:hypothetical protein